MDKTNDRVDLIPFLFNFVNVIDKLLKHVDNVSREMVAKKISPGKNETDLYIESSLFNEA